MYDQFNEECVDQVVCAYVYYGERVGDGKAVKVGTDLVQGAG
jgi:hypothetical protein